jgi:hypothetical protein
MQQLPSSSIGFKLGLRGWASVIVGLAIFATLIVFVSLLALGILVIAVPVFLVAPLVLYFRRRNAPGIIKEPPEDGPTVPNSQPETIDGTYRKTH